MSTTEDEDTAMGGEYVQEIAYLAPDMETTCQLCQAEFLDAEDLNAHVRQVHEGSRTYSKICQFCEATYTDLEDYARHIRDSHLTNLKYCRVCTKCFTDLRKVKKHVKKHYKDNMYACSQCPGLFTTANEVKMHEILNHDNKDDGDIPRCMPHLSSLLSLSVPALLYSEDMELICKSCNFTSGHFKAYIEHLEEGKCNVLVCNKCSDTFKTKNNLRKHFRRKNKCMDVTEYANELTTCPSCSNKVHSKHMQAHLKICKIYSCKICNIRFKMIDELSAHQTEAHPVELDIIRCKYCTKEYVGTNSLQKHIERSHYPTFHLFKYQCKSCNAIFKHPQNLFAHYFTKHKDLQPYTCKICDKTFKIRKQMTIHIKMVHKGEGVVEFDDQYHVFFTDKKSENPFVPKCVIPEEDLIKSQIANKAKQPIKRDHQESTADKDDSDTGTIELLLSEEEDPEVSAVETTKVWKDKEPKKKKKIRRSNKNIATSSSDEEAQPLHIIKKRAERKKFQQRFPTSAKRARRDLKRKNFTCNVCNKYCYTYQNYHNHIKIHSKNESIECVKCSRSFRTKNELTEHVTTDHATSRLIETLKSLRERKQGETHNVTNNDTSSCEPDTDSRSRFMKTIKKVKADKSLPPAKISIAPENSLVKNFIENFIPDGNETSKAVESDTTVTVKQYNSPFYRKNWIKMTKCTPEPPANHFKLKMPVKFTEEPGEKVTLKVQLVNEPTRQSMFESHEKFTSCDEDNADNFQDYDEYDDKNDEIPEVAHEVMLEGTEEPPKLNIQAPQKIVIPKLPKGYKNIHIATLQPQAPYYKIIKVKGNYDEPIVLDTVVKKDVQSDRSKPDIISLPDGTKFVTANPLAHLLGNKNMEKVLEPMKNKHYKPTITNFKGLFAEALQNLDKPSVLRTKKPKKKSAQPE